MIPRNRLAGIDRFVSASVDINTVQDDTIFNSFAKLWVFGISASLKPADSSADFSAISHATSAA
jgi:hypothetical protein